MQLYKTVRTCAHSILTFMHVQLFITLISMPILLCWGMPLSLLSFAGNFFFGPILTAFLLLSSLIFFFQLLALPSGAFIYALEKLTTFWMYILRLPSHQSLVALPKPPLITSLVIICMALLILHCKKIDTPLKGIAAYTILLIISGICLALTAYWAIPVQTIPCHSGQITLAYHHKQLALIDPGVVGQRISAPNWCEYTLMPYLAKEYGTTCIDYLILLQPNGVTFDAITRLLEKIKIKRMYIPLWTGTLPNHWWKYYFRLVEQCKKTGCILIRLHSKDIHTIFLGKESIAITPLESTLSNHEYTYPAFHISGTINSYEIDIYSQKFKKT